MKKFGSKLIFLGVVLVIGPLFGIGVRGLEDLDLSGCFVMGIVSISIGVIMNSISSKGE